MACAAAVICLAAATRDFLDGAIRVIAAARWPGGGVSGGRKVSAVMGLIDVMPTVMRIAGVQPCPASRRGVRSAVNGDRS